MHSFPLCALLALMLAFAVGATPLKRTDTTAPGWRWGDNIAAPGWKRSSNSAPGWRRDGSMAPGWRRADPTPESRRETDSAATPPWRRAEKEVPSPPGWKRDVNEEAFALPSV